MSTKVFKPSNIFILESGQILSEIEICYTTYGNMNAQKDNVIWICHALTGNSDPQEWWSTVIGDGKLYDPKDYFIVCANCIGSCYGSTGPLSIDPKTGKPYFHTFPSVTTKDIVATFELLRQHLQIESINTCIGGSLGGQQAVQWGVSNPNIFKNLILIATNAKHSPWGIAFNEAQRMSIKADQTWKDNNENAGLEGMKAARAIALLSYRNYETFQIFQSDEDSYKMKDFKACTYQQYQGEKISKRFNAFTYWLLTEVLDTHNVGRGYENVEKALAQINANTLVIGVTTDVLFPIQEQELMAKNIKNAQFAKIESIYGHDGFLIETDKIVDIIQKFYNSAS